MDFTKIKNTTFEGIDFNDYPDFVDAFCIYGELDGEIMTDDQLNELNEDSDYVYQCVMEKIF